MNYKKIGQYFSALVPIVIIFLIAPSMLAQTDLSSGLFNFLFFPTALILLLCSLYFFGQATKDSQSMTNLDTKASRVSLNISYLMFILGVFGLGYVFIFNQRSNTLIVSAAVLCVMIAPAIYYYGKKNKA